MARTTKIDLHTHTRGSDGQGSPDEIAHYAVEAGLDGICLTDHHRTYTRESLDVANACRTAGLLVFHGCEYSTDEGHLLIYGVNVEDLRLGYYPRIQKVINEVNRRGGVCIPSHPYKGYQRRLNDRVLRLANVPAYEVANGQVAYQCPEANVQAVIAQESVGVAGTGGSDAHNPEDIGLAYTRFTGVIKHERQFIEALRAGKRYYPVTQRGILARSIARRRADFEFERQAQAEEALWANGERFIDGAEL